MNKLLYLLLKTPDNAFQIDLIKKIAVVAIIVTAIFLIILFILIRFKKINIKHDSLYETQKKDSEYIEGTVDEDEKSN